MIGLLVEARELQRDDVFAFSGQRIIEAKRTECGAILIRRIGSDDVEHRDLLRPERTFAIRRPE